MAIHLADIITMTLLANLVHKFSSKFVISITLNFTEVTHSTKAYDSVIVRPLFVVLLSSMEEFAMFQRMTREFDMAYPIWLVIFGTWFFGTCHQPDANYFNIAFNTEMLVKCLGDPILREWYSVHEGSIAMYELASWDPISRLQLKTRQNIYERRHTLGGKILRIGTVKVCSWIRGFLINFSLVKCPPRTWTENYAQNSSSPSMIPLH